MTAVLAVLALQGGGWRRKTNVLTKTCVLHSGSGLFVFYLAHPPTRGTGPPCPPTQPRDRVYFEPPALRHFSPVWPLRMGRAVHGLTGDITDQ